MKRYLKIWSLLSINSIQAVIATRWAMLIFIFGKFLRMVMFFVFTYLLVIGSGGLMGYTHNEAALFLLTFYFVSATGQMFFREMYRLRPRVLSGELDQDIIRPVHPILRNVLGGFDIQDLFSLPLVLIVLISTISQFNFSLTALVFYLLTIINSLMIMFSLHVFLGGLIIMTPDVDHALMAYRDVENLARFPVDIYKFPLREIFTYIVPIGLIFTFPAKVFLGLVSWPTMILAIIFGILSLKISVKFWNFAVKKYSSASS